MKRIFFIDLENTGRHFLSEGTKLSASDTIILYHSAVYGSIPVDIINKIVTAGASYKLVTINTHEKNAMDFEICTYLGYLVGQNLEFAEYYIVSRDKGYGAAIDFIKNNIDQNISIRQISKIDNIIKEFENRETIRSVLAGYNKKCVSVAAQTFESAKNLNEYYAKLTKALPRDGKEIFRITKTLFKTVA